MENPYQLGNPKYSGVPVLEIWEDRLAGCMAPSPVFYIVHTDDLEIVFRSLMTGQLDFKFEHRLHLN